MPFILSEPRETPLKITLKRDDLLLVCLKFGQSMKDFPFRAGDKVDVAVNLKENVYKGTRGITVLVKDIRPSGEDEDAFFGDRSIYEKFVSAGGLSAAQAEKNSADERGYGGGFPLSARGHSGFRFSYEMLLVPTRLSSELRQMMICLDVMTEFGFITRDYDGKNCVITLADKMQKTILTIP